MYMMLMCVCVGGSLVCMVLVCACAGVLNCRVLGLGDLYNAIDCIF